jgi:hypothetical protein
MQLLINRIGRRFDWLYAFEMDCKVKVQMGCGADTIMVVSPKAPKKKVKRSMTISYGTCDYPGPIVETTEIKEYEEELPDFPVKTASEWLKIIEDGKIGEFV